MTRLLFLSLRSVTPVGVGVGVLSAVAASRYARPAAVGALRVGFEAKNEVTRFWNDVKSSAEEMASEARKPTK